MLHSPRLVSLGLGALIVVGSLARLAFSFEAMPPFVASHFDGLGRPDGFQSRLEFAVSALALGAGLLLLFVALPWCMHKLPVGMINLPNRTYWLAPERAERSIERAAGLLDWFALSTIALLAAVFELVVRANLTRAPLDGAVTWLLALYIGFALVWSVSFLRAFRLR